LPSPAVVVCAPEGLNGLAHVVIRVVSVRHTRAVLTLERLRCDEAVRVTERECCWQSNPATRRCLRVRLSKIGDPNIGEVVAHRVHARLGLRFLAQVLQSDSEGGR